MRNFYRNKENTAKEEYLNKMCIKLEKEDIHSIQIIPDILNSYMI